MIQTKLLSDRNLSAGMTDMKTLKGKKTVNDIVREFCNTCSGKTKHEILHHEEVEWEEGIGEDNSIYGANVYDLLKRLGCEHVVLRHNSWFSEEIDPETGRHEIRTTYYPPATYRKAPKWLSDLMWTTEYDDSLEEIMREIYVALQNDAPRLATIGIRALIELVMIDKIGDQGTFSKNLDAFESAGFISVSQRKVLEPVLEAGHATIHRNFKLKKNEVARLMDIAESIIESIYISMSKE
jgi:hypothetical protein